MSALPSRSRLPFEPPPLRLTDQRLACEVRDSFDGLEPLRAEWDRLVEAVGAPVDMTFDWCATWWAHYGAERESRIYLFREEERLVGVAPVCIGPLELGPASLRVARLMGADSMPTMCDVPAEGPWAEAVIDELLEKLIAREKCDAVLIGPISEASGRVDLVRAAASRRPDRMVIVRDRLVTRHTTIAVAHTFDAYVRTLSEDQRFNIRKGWRRLNDDFDVSVETITKPQVAPAELEAFDRMHTAQWEARGRLGYFGDWPGARPFHLALVEAMSRARRLRMLRLRADGRVVARQYAYVFGGTCSCRLATRADEPQWSGYGLGLLSAMKLFERVIDEGVATIDAGVGHDDYKLRLGGREHEVRSILIAANRGSARRRARIAGVVADAIDRLYFRLWHRRIAPRLPGRRSPLHPAWIRSRL